MSNCMFKSGRRRFRASVRAAPREPSIVLAGIDRSSALAGLSKLPVLALPDHQAWARFALGDRTLVDRVLYLPKTCTEDRECCRVAEVPDEREFATKGDLARHIVLRFRASPLPRCTARTESRTVPAGPAPAPGPARPGPVPASDQAPATTARPTTTVRPTRSTAATGVSRATTATSRPTGSHVINDFCQDQSEGTWSSAFTRARKTAPRADARHPGRRAHPGAPVGALRRHARREHLLPYILCLTDGLPCILFLSGS